MITIKQLNIEAKRFNLEEALGIDGEVMGTGNKQEMDNKFIGGGSF